MRILATADWHMGKKTHGRHNSTHNLNQRLLDVCQRVDEIGRIAGDQSADLILFAGDAFDHPTPSPTQQRLLYDRVKKLAGAAPVVMIPGNHDHPISEGRRHAFDLFREISGVYVFDEPTVARFGVKPDGSVQKAPGELADEFVLAAMPWPLEKFKGSYNSVRDRYVALVEQAEEKGRSRGISVIAMGHFTVHGSLPGGSESSLEMGRETVFSVEDFAGADMTVLGHIHKHQDLGSESKPVVYTSSPERLSFGEEGEEKGVLVFDTNDPADWKLVETTARRFVTVEHDLRQRPDATTATDWLCQQIEESYDTEDAVVRVRYQAEAPVDETKVFSALSDAYIVSAIERQTEEAERMQSSNGADADASTEDLLEQFGHSRELSSDAVDRMKDMASVL